MVAALGLCAGLWAQSAAGDDTINGTPRSEISYALLRNEFFQESLKQRSLARLTLAEGEYDQSAWHSAEAERYARLSDEFIARRLLEARLSREMKEAAERISWARANEAETYFPEQLKTGESRYAAAVELRAAADLEGALENATAALAALALIAAPPKRSESGKLELPQDLPDNPDLYTVRPWDSFGDCFWNIAQRFYGNPRKWPELYEANKDKLPDINNPNLIEVGTVISIPNLGGELRAGNYDTGQPFPR
jgi:hypothetical protein